jgi:hypothetical protein
MELSIDAGTKGLLGALGAIKSSIHFLAKRKAAELAALKLVRSKLEEHVERFMLFDLDQNRSALGNKKQHDHPDALLLSHHFR